MNFQNILSDQTVQQIGWTLIHFLWQAAAAAIVLASVLLWLRKSKASARYIAACATLALMVAAPCVTFYCVGKSHVRAEVAADGGAVAISAAPVLVEALAPAGTEPAITHASPSSTSPAGTLRLTEKAKLLLEPALPYLVFGWLAGVFALSLWYVGGWSQLQRYKRKMTSAVSQRDYRKVKELAELLRIRRAVRVLQSALVQVPTVVGWLRPVILLPASAMTGLSFEQLEAILAHELAHIRRCDYLVNMLQTTVEILGFYHPAVWWVSHKIRVERENCCDDLAVAVCGDKVRYARALALLEEMRADRPRLAVAANAGSLLGRIRRLVGDASKENKSSAWVGAVITLLVLALAIPSTLALSGGSTSKPEKPDARTLFENLRHAQRPVENMRVEFGYESWAFPPGGSRWRTGADANRKKYVLWRHDYTALISGRRSRFEWQMSLFRNKDDKEPFQSGRTISVFDGQELRSLAENSKKGRRSPRDDNERRLLVLLQAIPSDLKDLVYYEKIADEYNFDVIEGDKPGLYILDAVRKEDGMHWQLTIDGNRGFNNVKTVLFRSDGSDSVSRQTNVTLREYPGGIWYPAELEKIDNSAVDVGRRIVTTVSAEFDVDVGADAFELKWPAGTKVFDVFRKGHVTIGENGEPAEFTPLSDDRPRPRRAPATEQSREKPYDYFLFFQGRDSLMMAKVLPDGFELKNLDATVRVRSDSTNFLHVSNGKVYCMSLGVFKAIDIESSQVDEIAHIDGYFYDDGCLYAHAGEEWSIYDLRKRAYRKDMPFAAPAYHLSPMERRVAFSPDKKRLAYFIYKAEAGVQLKVVNTVTGQVTEPCPPFVYHESPAGWADALARFRFVWLDSENILYFRTENLGKWENALNHLVKTNVVTGETKDVAPFPAPGFCTAELLLPELESEPVLVVDSGPGKGRYRVDLEQGRIIKGDTRLGEFRLSAGGYFTALELHRPDSIHHRDKQIAGPAIAAVSPDGKRIIWTVYGRPRNRAEARRQAQLGYYDSDEQAVRTISGAGPPLLWFRESDLEARQEPEETPRN